MVAGSRWLGGCKPPTPGAGVALLRDGHGSAGAGEKNPAPCTPGKDPRSPRMAGALALDFAHGGGFMAGGRSVHAGTDQQVALGHRAEVNAVGESFAKPGGRGGNVIVVYDEKLHSTMRQELRDLGEEAAPGPACGGAKGGGGSGPLSDEAVTPAGMEGGKPKRCATRKRSDSDVSDDEVEATPPRWSPGGGPREKKRIKWTEEEEHCLAAAVLKCGMHDWAAVQQVSSATSPLMVGHMALLSVQLPRHDAVPHSLPACPRGAGRNQRLPRPDPLQVVVAKCSVRLSPSVK